MTQCVFFVGVTALLYYCRLFHVASMECMFDTHGSRGRCRMELSVAIDVNIVSNVEPSTDPTTRYQPLNTSPHLDLVLHYGRNTAAKRAGQRATGSSCRANIPTCGEDYSGVPGRSRPLQKRGYPAEKTSGTAVRFESRSNIKQSRCVTKVVFNVFG